MSDTKKNKCKHCAKPTRGATTCVKCLADEARATRFRPVVEAFVASFPVPEGFVKTTGDGWHNGRGHEANWAWAPEGCTKPWWNKTTYVLIANEEAGIRVAVNVSLLPEMYQKWEKARKVGRPQPTLSGSGHTCYMTDRGFWSTFDRLGVDDSFYLRGDATIAELIKEQLGRVATARETSKQMVDIPGFGYRVHRDQVEALKKKIQAGGHHTFTPPGFGTGHVVSTKRRQSSNRLPNETASFFGVVALYDDTFDHD